jgi:ABC-2 type transport system permease protein
MKRLWTTFRYTFVQLKGQILGWGIGLALLGLIIVPFYDVFGGEQAQFQQLLQSYPEEFLAFFGGDADSVLTPTGYLKMYAFSMLPLIIGIFSVLAGSGLIVNDEERGRLDLIVTHPVGRTSLFFGRFLGLFGAAFAILLIGWLGFCLLLGQSSLNLSWGQVAVPFVSLFAQVMIYAAFAILLSMILPTRNLAAMITGAVLVVSYFVSSMIFLDERLELAAKLLPHYYYQVELSLQGLNLLWLFGLLGASAAMLLLAWLLFMKRDIRLAGEGSWRLPQIFRKQLRAS